MNYFGAWIGCPFCRREILAEETKEGKNMDEIDSTHYVCERCKIEIVIKERGE
jgi:DNA-directed RNA polymerase subunit RPC12/RpoP